MDGLNTDGTGWDGAIKNMCLWWPGLKKVKSRPANEIKISWKEDLEQNWFFRSIISSSRKGANWMRYSIMECKRMHKEISSPLQIILWVLVIISNTDLRFVGLKRGSQRKHLVPRGQWVSDYYESGLENTWDVYGNVGNLRWSVSKLECSRGWKVETASLSRDEEEMWKVFLFCVRILGQIFPFWNVIMG